MNSISDLPDIYRSQNQIARASSVDVYHMNRTTIGGEQQRKAKSS